MTPGDTVFYILLLAVAYWVWASVFGGPGD